MFRLTAIFLMVASLGAAPASGQNRQANIQGVISNQIEAFGIDDFETAFGYASPTIQRLFQTPEFFGQMVMQGYPMVWRPGSVRFGGQTESDGQVLQRVFIRDLNGNGFIATYEMQMRGNTWEINGVQIEPQADVGA